MDRQYQLHPRRIVLAYLLLAGVWIVASDYLADSVFHMPELHSFKGLLFVVATGGILYGILARSNATMQNFKADLLASQQQFKLLVETAPEAIFLQTDSRFRYLNPAALRFFGTLNREELLGRPVLDFITPEHQDAIRERIRGLLQARIPAPLREVEFLRIDGTRVYADVSAAPLEVEGDRGAVVFVRDISARKRAERQEQQLREEVRQAQKMESLGRLAGGVAHDFNNLLTIINGYSEMLLDELKDGPHVTSIREIRDAGDRAASLTRQLLAFSRKEVGERAIIDVNNLVRDSERMLARLVGEHIRLTTVLDPAAGPIFADPTWIHQVLMNLVINSRDAMPGGGTIEVRTVDIFLDEEYCRTETSAKPGRYVRLSIADNGTGMTEDVAARAFDPFFTTKPQGQGTGLGLSTVYGIVHNVGGWVAVESKPSLGTTMHIWLPVSAERHAGPGPAPATRGLNGRETILLVEDDPVVRQATAAMLLRYDYSVVAVDSGAAALEMVRGNSSRVDLLLSDVMMPDMNGVELAKQVLALHPDLRVMLMSGYRPDEVVASTPNLPFISKPFTAATLAARIRHLIDGR